MLAAARANFLVLLTGALRSLERGFFRVLLDATDFADLVPPEKRRVLESFSRNLYFFAPLIALVLAPEDLAAPFAALVETPVFQPPAGPDP